MQSTLLILALAVSAASAALVVPPFKDFEQGLYVAVYEKQAADQQPLFEVVFVNPTEATVSVRTMLRSFLPQSEKFGMMEVSSTCNDYRMIAAAFDDMTITVPPMSPRTYVIKPKVWSPYN